MAAILAILLIAYVFMGSSGERPVSSADARALCSTQRAYEAIKRELFRRAAQLRGSEQPAFNQVSTSSVVRMQSPVVRGSSSGAADCTGQLAIDLPPGVEAAGNRRTLAGEIGYSVRTVNGATEVFNLTNADQLINLLATLGQAPGEREEGQAVPAPAQSGQAAGTETQALQSPPQTSAPAPVAAPSVSPPVRRVELPRPQPNPRQTAEQVPVRRPTPPPPVRTPPRPTPRPAVTESRKSAQGRPSYNCRYARTGAEIAVCNDAHLAGLDRQMAGMFNRGLRAATPAQRELLQRTRGRFLGFREACRNSECIANTYRSRMLEISDIMAGRWRVP